MTLDDILALPVSAIVAEPAHLYLWIPNALLPEDLRVLAAWGAAYKSNLLWHKIGKDGGPDGRGVGFYFRKTTEFILFSVRGRGARTLAPGRRQVNIIRSRTREHSRKPDEAYDLIESCSPGPFLEMFARGSRSGWTTWRSEAAHYVPDWPTCAHHSQAHAGKDRPPRRNARREAKRKRGTLDQEKLKDSSPFDFVPASAVRPAS